MTGPDPRRTVLPGALLCLGAAALTMIGVGQALFTWRLEAGSVEPRQSVTITAWEFQSYANGERRPDDGGALLNGLPLTAAAAILLAAAFGMLVASSRPAARLAGVSRMAAVVGAAFLAATVCTVGVQVLYWLDVFQSVDPQAPPQHRTHLGDTAWVGFLVAGRRCRAGRGGRGARLAPGTRARPGTRGAGHAADRHPRRGAETAGRAAGRPGAVTVGRRRATADGGPSAAGFVEGSRSERPGVRSGTAAADARATRRT